MEINYDLERFVAAQNKIFPAVLKELQAGRKESQWMWYIFPQIEGLGVSQTASFFALSGKAEAKAYLAHPVLGPRLVDCTKLALKHAKGGATALFGPQNEIKFQSSLSLFSRAKPCSPVFEEALNAFFGGVACQPTLKILRIAFHESLNS